MPVVVFSLVVHMCRNERVDLFFFLLNILTKRKKKINVDFKLLLSGKLHGYSYAPILIKVALISFILFQSVNKLYIDSRECVASFIYIYIYLVRSGYTFRLKYFFFLLLLIQSLI